MITNPRLVGYSLWWGAISWASKKQMCISHSTMESKFIALAATSKEVEWLRNMLLDIELWPQLIPAIFVYYDSEATLGKVFKPDHSLNCKRERFKVFEVEPRSNQG